MWGSVVKEEERLVGEEEFKLCLVVVSTFFCVLLFSVLDKEQQLL